MLPGSSQTKSCPTSVGFDTSDNAWLESKFHLRSKHPCCIIPEPSLADQWTQGGKSELARCWHVGSRSKLLNG